MQSAVMAQKFGHVTIAPLQKYGSQPGSPAVPSSLGVHTPMLPRTLHASHALMQAVLQHTPSTQWPLEHSFPAPHAAPFAL